MSGIIHLLPLYDFMEWIGTTWLYISTHSLTGHTRSGCIVTRLGTGWSRHQHLTSHNGKRCSSSPEHTNQLCTPPSLLFGRYQLPPSQVEWVGHEDDYTPPSTAKVNNAWCYDIYNPTPQYLLGMVISTGTIYLYLSLFTHCSHFNTQVVINMQSLGIRPLFVWLCLGKASGSTSRNTMWSSESVCIIWAKGSIVKL